MDHGRADGLRYVPIEPRPWRLAMGLRPLDPVHWLEVDSLRGRELQQKWAILDSPAGHSRSVASIAGATGAGAELLELVLGSLDACHPGLVTRAGPSAVVDSSTGRRVDMDALHPVDAAGRLVQEDLCVMTRPADRWVLGAASVCFPSRWSLADKIGRDLGAIHGPVPGYGTALGRPVDGFFDRLRAERPMWRLNWTLLDTPELSLPDGDSRRAPAPPGDDIGAHLWFRVERQTLRRLERSGAVVFTIRTYVTALGDLVRSHPAVVDDLLLSLETTPAATVAYKGWGELLAPVVDWLTARRPEPG